GAGCPRRCTTAPTGSTPAVRASSCTSASSRSSSVPGARTASTSPRSTSAGCSGRFTPRLCRGMAENPTVDSLARRTLELVDIPRFLDQHGLHADLVVMLEPTGNAIQAGCLGNLNARLVFQGASAHSARPWLGDNAIEHAIRGLAGIAALQPVDVEIQGLLFREVLSITGIEGGIATN